MKKIVIIGTGRVGLPLALSLKETGLNVFGIDLNQKLIDDVNNGIMPFHEPGYDDLIKKGFKIYNNIKEVENATDIIITVGTPLMNHTETDLTFVKNVLKTLIPHLKKNQNIIMRSTLAPKTMSFIKNYLDSKTKFKVGKDFFLSYCPERLAEGKAYTELKTLPQIIGADDKKSFERAKEIFSKLTNKIHETTFTNAELTKLYNNIHRYIQFATANHFAYIAEHFGGDIYDILKYANEDYPRGGIARPGFTAGTCLRKDFGMINEHFPFNDMLTSAWKINEFTPKFLIDTLLKTETLKGKVVGVIGYTFKKDTDDIRDSLVPKLVRYIERENPKEVLIHDHKINHKFVDTDTLNCDIDMIHKSDIIFVGTNHSNFDLLLKKIQKQKRRIVIVDIWNTLGNNKIIYTNKDLKNK